VITRNSSLQPNSVPCIHLAITIIIILNETQITGKQFYSQSFQESPYDSLFCAEKWRLGAGRVQEVSLGKWTLYVQMKHVVATGVSPSIKWTAQYMIISNTIPPPAVWLLSTALWPVSPSKYSQTWLKRHRFLRNFL